MALESCGDHKELSRCVCPLDLSRQWICLAFKPYLLTDSIFAQSVFIPIKMLFFPPNLSWALVKMWSQLWCLYSRRCRVDMEIAMKRIASLNAVFISTKPAKLILYGKWFAFSLPERGFVSYGNGSWHKSNIQLSTKSFNLLLLLISTYSCT